MTVDTVHFSDCRLATDLGRLQLAPCTCDQPYGTQLPNSSSFAPVETPGEPARPGWDEVWMRTAEIVAERSSCLRPNAKMAVVFTSPDYELIATGVNGAPRGLPNCLEVGCLMVEGHCRRTIHDAINGIIQASRSARSLKGSYAYMLARPCISCSVALIQAGVARVVYRREYDTDLAKDAVLEMFAEADVRLEKIP